MNIRQVCFSVVLFLVASTAALAHGPVPYDPAFDRHAIQNPHGLVKQTMYRCPLSVGLTIFTTSAVFDCMAVVRAWVATLFEVASRFSLTEPDLRQMAIPTFYFVDRATFDAERLIGYQQPVDPPGMVTLGFWAPQVGAAADQGPFVIWTWQPVTRFACEGLDVDGLCGGGRQTVIHEMTHHMVNELNWKHLGNFHNRVGRTVNEQLP